MKMACSMSTHLALAEARIGHHTRDDLGHVSPRAFRARGVAQPQRYPGPLLVCRSDKNQAISVDDMYQVSGDVGVHKATSRYAKSTVKLTEQKHTYFLKHKTKQKTDTQHPLKTHTKNAVTVEYSTCITIKKRTHKHTRYNPPPAPPLPSAHPKANKKQNKKHKTIKKCPGETATVVRVSKHTHTKHRVRTNTKLLRSTTIRRHQCLRRSNPPPPPLSPAAPPHTGRHDARRQHGVPDARPHASRLLHFRDAV